jgi:hypothetical protein
MNEEEEKSRVKDAEEFKSFTPAYGGVADPNLIAMQQDTGPLLESIKAGWLGLYYDTMENVWRRGTKKAMNVKGAERFINEIRIRSCNITFLSNLTEEQVYSLKEEAEHTTNELLFMEEDDFEVEQTHKDLIINDLGQAILIGLLRAKDQGEKKFLSKTYEVKQTFQEREKQKKGLKRLFMG